MTTATYLPDYPVNGLDDAQPREITVSHAPVDQAFRQITRLSGSFVLLIMLLVGTFLTIKAVRAIKSVGLWDFITTQAWSPETNHFGIAALLFGTVTVALIALVVALPLSLGGALFITEISSGWAKSILTGAIDLMAAVPSVVYGLFGLVFLQKHMVPFAYWLSTYFGWIPLFKVDGADPKNPLPNDALYTSSSLIGGVIVSMMIIPIMTSMMRESFSRAPAGEREGAYALGATRWGMIRSVVLPFGRGGIIGGTMLGLGRALGETIAVYLILSPIFDINLHVLQNGGNTVAMTIALRYGEANDFTMSALMAAGLALFLMTMAINFTASAIIARSRSGADSEA
ncbi:phosphate ABC transporter permease subunit PstC [Nocardioides marmorisolisilvae]|uniref:phosphate ABC transporter permease subunit PstC n=1 Tax=Nocardioides marmorisolisilvae TaxID=1542737 RepID=UPI001C8364B0|nr:phosphate ABC transporter permease subunit PstC [Nocardioides marmorisolisilvae]